VDSSRGIAAELVHSAALWSPQAPQSAEARPGTCSCRRVLGFPSMGRLQWARWQVGVLAQATVQATGPPLARAAALARWQGRSWLGGRRHESGVRNAPRMRAAGAPRDAARASMPPAWQWAGTQTVHIASDSEAPPPVHSAESALTEAGSSIGLDFMAILFAAT
jgi:hypothetical protein